MELKEFLSEALVQIIEGVETAQAKVVSSNAEISPTYSDRQGDIMDKNKILVSSKGGIIQHVDFDIAVSATEGTGTKAGIGVITGAFNLGASGSSKQENQTASRIKFSVPITLPTKNE